jgi:hypothetical protein
MKLNLVRTNGEGGPPSSPMDKILPCSAACDISIRYFHALFTYHLDNEGSKNLCNVGLHQRTTKRYILEGCHFKGTIA